MSTLLPSFPLSSTFASPIFKLLHLFTVFHTTTATNTVTTLPLPLLLLSIKPVAKGWPVGCSIVAVVRQEVVVKFPEDMKCDSSVRCRHVVIGLTEHRVKLIQWHVFTQQLVCYSTALQQALQLLQQQTTRLITLLMLISLFKLQINENQLIFKINFCTSVCTSVWLN